MAGEEKSNGVDHSQQPDSPPSRQVEFRPDPSSVAFTFNPGIENYMKKTGIIISLALHALFLTIAVVLPEAHPPVPPLIIPVSLVDLAKLPPNIRLETPGEIYSPPPPVIVRPFILPEGKEGKGEEPGQGNSRNSQAKEGLGNSQKVRPQEIKQWVSSPADASEREFEGSKDDATVEPGLRQKNPEQIGFRIDPREIIRSWNHPKAGSSGAAGAFSTPGITAFPFSDSDEGGIGGTGPGVAISGGAFFDGRGFDITPWAKRVIYRIKKNWFVPPAANFSVPGRIELLVIIQRDGRISRITVAQGTPFKAYEEAATHALALSVPFPSLPESFPYSEIRAYLIFQYNTR